MPPANSAVPPGRWYKFGPFRLEPAEHLLARGGQPLAIAPKAFDLLTILVARAGHLVTKEELLKDVWADAFVEEANLSYTISLLRKALGDDAAPHQFIETVPKRGYRFVAPVDASTSCEAAPNDAAKVPTVMSRGELRPRNRRVGRSTVAAVVVAGFLVLVAAETWRPGRSAVVNVAPMRVMPLTTLSGDEDFVTFSPEGDRVAFTSKGAEGINDDIYVKVVGSSQVQRLTTNLAADLAPSWSPDGRSIAFVRWDRAGMEDQARIHVMPSIGGSDLKLSDFAVAPAKIDWSPDGHYVAAAHAFPVTALAGGWNTGIYLIPVQGGEPRALTHARAPVVDFSPAFSPDGRRLAYVSCMMADSCHVFVVGLDAALTPTAPPRRLTTQVTWHINGLTWSRDGTSIIFGMEVASTLKYLWRVAVDRTGPPERIESAGLASSNPATVRSRDLLAFTKALYDTDINSFEPGHPPRRWLASSLVDYGAQFSADGRRIVFASARSGDAIEIWVATADGSSPQQLTHGPGPWQGSPQWSPDGRRVAFDSLGTDGSWHIWTIDAEGGAPHQVTQGPGSQNVPSWSADGQWIYFSVKEGSGRNIWRAKLPGGVMERVTSSGSGFFARESVDGKNLLYQTEISNHAPLVALQIGGGPPRQVVRCVQAGAFADNVQGMYYVQCGTAPDPWVHWIERRTGKNRPLGRLESYAPGATQALSVSPDGRAILYTRHAGHGSDLMLVENFR